MQTASCSNGSCRATWQASADRVPAHDDEIDAIRDAILDGAPGDELAALPLPDVVRGALVRADEQEMFAGVAVGGQGPAQVAARRGVPAARSSRPTRPSSR